MSVPRLVVWLCVGLSASPAWSATYYCVDASGRPIFTDIPSQLDECVLLDGERATPPPSPPRSPDDVPSPALPAPDSAAQPPLQGGADGDRADGQASEPGLARVPIARSGKSLIVQVRLNGTREATLILDTGADITILSHAIALDLGLFPSSTNPTVTLNTVGGQVRADVVRISSVLVGEAEARDVLAVIHDLPDAPTGIDGLLGLTFLDKFVVTLDVQKGELQLRRR